jgi:hypothetical protein
VRMCRVLWDLWSSGCYERLCGVRVGVGKRNVGVRGAVVLYVAQNDIC